MRGQPIVHTQSPYNAEPRLDVLRSSFVTAQHDFYVRSHGDIPDIDAASHLLSVQGLVDTPLELTVAQLRDRFAVRTVHAVMQCAGNRRADLQPVRPTTGDAWAPGAIGYAAWTGIALVDLLEAAGAATGEALHVAFDCRDEVEVDGEGRFRFGVSIPLAKAMSPETLVAFEMNGEPLAPAHGYPMRLVVPGFAGVRSPKWLSSITVQDRPSDNHMQQRDYKLVPSEMTEHDVDWSRGITINDMPLNAAICEPAPDASLAPGPTRLRGYAIATGRAVVRVDVSADGGASWRQADLEAADGRPWAWTFWSAELDLPSGAHELVVRAWDSAGQTQPAEPRETWNFKGYLSAAWHRVPVTVGSGPAG